MMCNACLFGSYEPWTEPSLRRSPSSRTLALVLVQCPLAATSKWWQCWVVYSVVVTASSSSPFTMDGRYVHQFSATTTEVSRAHPSNSNEEDLHEGGRVHVIKIPRTLVLNELVRSLGGDLPSSDCICVLNGYSACIKANIPKFQGSAEIVQVIGRSCTSHDTESEIEKDAEDLINSLQGEFNLEINDINWETSKRLEASVWKLEQKVISLKNLVDSLVDGWAYSLEFADIMCSMSSAVCSSAYSELDFAGLGGEGAEIVISTTVRVKNLAKFAWMEGTTAMRRVLRVGV